MLQVMMLLCVRSGRISPASLSIGLARRLHFGSPPIQRKFASSSSPQLPERAKETKQADERAKGPASGVVPLSSGSVKPGALKSSSAQPVDWEENPDYGISKFSQLPHTNFGVNQHMLINDELKEALRQILWQFRAPIRYAFAYGSGVFPQGAPSAASTSSKSSIHPSPSPAIAAAQRGSGKVIDFIFGVSYTQHWHSLNLQQHRDHYSALGHLGSAVVSYVQDEWGAGVYFNPYVTVNGTLIKYGVVNLDTLCRDLSEWDTLYLAGRLQKPVKILRDDPRVRLANQVNLISALRTALLLLPPNFTEKELYGAIAGISYMGDPRMSMPSENPNKVANIVQGQMSNFRRLYAPLIENLPNVSFKDPRCSDPQWGDDPQANVALSQDMDPVKRGNMVRRLPTSFRQKLYFNYQSKFQIPTLDFNKMLELSTDEDETGIKRRQGGVFERRVAGDVEGLRDEVALAIRKTVSWPSTSQSLKGVLTAGVSRSWRYMKEKRQKYREGSETTSNKENGQPNKKGPASSNDDDALTDGGKERLGS
ncbi:MAG: Mitochondrial translocator assembly and maintenance protein 41 [Trizodia sp. TS-e1964]|nr:MAG: Mitochondrial translocator assembly and maintenance protein 41 [Trizodia sp. TS-e1964]